MKVITRVLRLFLLLFVGFFVAGCFEKESTEQSAHPYNETADAESDIAQALTNLDGKRLLLVFGANWCPDCRRVDASLKQPAITGFLDEHFAVVKIDVGNFDKNMEISERFGLPTKKGIPALVVVSTDSEIERVVKGDELAKEHKKGRDAFYQWLKEF